MPIKNISSRWISNDAVDSLSLDIGNYLLNKSKQHTTNFDMKFIQKTVDEFLPMGKIEIIPIEEGIKKGIIPEDAEAYSEQISPRINNIYVDFKSLAANSVDYLCKLVHELTHGIQQTSQKDFWVAANVSLKNKTPGASAYVLNEMDNILVHYKNCNNLNDENILKVYKQIFDNIKECIKNKPESFMNEVAIRASKEGHAYNNSYLFAMQNNLPAEDIKFYNNYAQLNNAIYNALK